MCLNAARRLCRPSDEHVCTECCLRGTAKPIDWNKPIRFVRNTDYVGERYLGTMYKGGKDHLIVGKPVPHKGTIEYSIAHVDDFGIAEHTQFNVENYPPPKVKYDVYSLRRISAPSGPCYHICVPHGASIRNSKYGNPMFWLVIEMQTVEFNEG